MNRHRGKIAIAVLFALTLAAFFFFDLDRFFTLVYIRSRHEELVGLFHEHPFLTYGAFLGAFTAYVVTGLMGTWLVMIAAGSIFGVWLGALGVGLAYAIGGTIQFLLARYLFRDWAERRFSARLAKLDREMDRDGVLVLFSLRLMSIIPYATINLSMALTSIKVVPFFVVTLIADVIIGAVYANAGTHLMEITSIKDVLSGSLVLSLALLGIFPLAVKLVLNRTRAGRLPPSA